MKAARAARVIALLAATCCVSGGAWAACTVSATAVAFGNYDPSSGTDRTANGSVAVNCSLGLPPYAQNYVFTVSFGTGNSTNYSRYMLRAGGTERLNYNLYSTTSQVLGNGTAGTVTFQDNILLIWLFGTSGSVVFPVAGRVPAMQNARPGTYSDTIIVTLNY